MNQPANNPIRFSDMESVESADYVPVSLLAVVSLVLGLLSAVALLHPLLSGVGVVAICLSALALRRIAGSETPPTGRSLALVGLFLPMLFCSWSYSREFVRQKILYSHGRDFAEQWLTLVRNQKMQEAHQLSLMPDQRAARGERALADFYRPRPKRELGALRTDAGAPTPERANEILESMGPTQEEQLRMFIATPGMSRLVAFGDQLKFEHDSNFALSAIDAVPESIQVVYRVFDARNPSKALLVRLSLERHTDSATADWRLAEIKLIE